ncbi:MAG TPA: hypothetical protein VMU28_06020 [Terriglobales bacterium]|nr:hypothetical protein [Terriglobales bacterium]
MIKRLLLFALLVTSIAFAAPKIEKIGSFGDGSDKLKAALQADGYRVYLPNTLACCEIWLAKTVTANKKEVPAANYPEFHESEFLGVIRFGKDGGGDLRGQSIKPGAYTMRYELLPSDGNHMGVAPYPDFVLLIPVADDPDPAAQFDFAKMIELSTKASRTAHPAAFEMMPAASGDSPTVTQTDDGWIVFQGSIAADNGKTMNLAFVVKGSSQ